MYKILKILIYIALYILDSFDKSKYELDSTGKIVNSFALKNVRVGKMLVFYMRQESLKYGP